MSELVEGSPTRVNMSKFYFGSGSGELSSDDEDNLPYPEALPRSDFLAPDFNAPAYLSTLSERHQTLEDLRSDLRERSQALSKELLDLVNTNYEQFLSLGSDLKGGEEKVEDVRVGLLSFRRSIEDVREKVKERKLEVDGLLKEKTEISRKISLARNLLEVDARLEELEDRLMVASLGRTVDGSNDDTWSESEDDQEDDVDAAAGIGAGGTGIAKLQRLATDYRYVKNLADSVGKDHPFVVNQQPRLSQVRNTILLDLNTSLKQTSTDGEAGKTRLIRILSIYRELGAAEDAIKIFRDLKSR